MLNHLASSPASASKDSIIQEWIDSESLSQNPEINSRNLFARKHAEKEPDAIVQKYTGYSLNGLKTFLRHTITKTDIELKGTGIELGAGAAGISNTLLSLYPIEKIYAIEIVPDVTKLLLCKVTKEMGNEDRLVPVIGSFDDIKLPDTSVDFAVELDSLHHANDLDKALREVARVLKPGGILIAYDRINADALSEAQRNFMLDIEYQETFKHEYGMPLGTKITRRDNGEHEIRECEWVDSLKRAGFKIEKIRFFHKRCSRGILYAFISLIPFKIRQKRRFYHMLVRYPLSFFLHYLFPWNSRYKELPKTFVTSRKFFMQGMIIARKNA
jgi:ubiquinone/menaquinone biosynthesis C-methylase UbiE